MDNLQNNDVGVCLTSWSNKLRLPSVNLWNRSWFVTFVGPRRLFQVSCGSRPSDRGGGGGGHPEPEMGGGAKRNFFRPIWASFWPKNKGVPEPPGPLPLDPPLLVKGQYRTGAPLQGLANFLYRQVFVQHQMNTSIYHSQPSPRKVLSTFIFSYHSLRKRPTFRDPTIGFPRKMTSEKQAQKFRTEDLSPSRFW